jgi:hypothetical protein
LDAATKAAAARDRHIEREQRAKAERAAERKRAKKAKERETRALKGKPRGPPGLQFATERKVAKPGHYIPVEDQARRPKAERTEEQQKRETLRRADSGYAAAAVGSGLEAGLRGGREDYPRVLPSDQRLAPDPKDSRSIRAGLAYRI